MAKKSWTKMTTEELADATREFDGGPGPKVRKPSAAQLAKHRKAWPSGSSRQPKRGRGRPPLGEGAVRVLFTIEPTLLMKLDAFARKHGMKRSQVIALGVLSYMDDIHVSRKATPSRQTGGGVGGAHPLAALAG